MSSVDGAASLEAWLTLRAMEKDRELVARQLGREPRAFRRVAVRCPFGRPAVTEQSPYDRAGEPFPTTYYVTCHDDYMKGNFGKTNFGGVIMHGMNNFGLISRMITDWAYPAGAIHRRLETRWLKPVRPGDTIQPSGIVKSKQATVSSRWVLIDVVVRNQNDEKVATGEAMVEFPQT